jgi:hypothetical protein
MQRRAPIVAIFAILGFFPSCLTGSDELNQRLKRIYDSPAFAGKPFGPARWIRGGGAFTTLEDAPSSEGAKDIAEYDTATGKRSIRVSHTQLIPPKAGKPLAVDDYRWDKDGIRLLVYTESRQVWRTNSRGDYWVLDRSAGTLKKLGGDAPGNAYLSGTTWDVCACDLPAMITTNGQRRDSIAAKPQLFVGR